MMILDTHSYWFKYGAMEGFCITSGSEGMYLVKLHTLVKRLDTESYWLRFHQQVTQAKSNCLAWVELRS